MTTARLARATTAVLGTLALLTACSQGGTDDTKTVTVVASTSLWGDLAQAVVAGHDGVTVSSVISGTQDDPHEYEPSARDLASVRDADIAVANGAGYDTWFSEAAGDDTELVSALPADDDGTNPHVWFDLDTTSHLADHLAVALHARDDAIPDRATEVTRRIDELKTRVAQLPAGAALLTEPVAADLIEGTPLRNVTPEGYAHATLAEAEPSAADIDAARRLIEDGTVTVLVTNRQSESPAAAQLTKAAEARGVRIVNVNETPDEGQDYFGYVGAVLDGLAGR
ncbi:zinc ABC transporter substrate-binding protein [Corynebacterium bovis]|uniref:metal ABC transporter solute-binding protein, Zn/Mn family n=1 Tax=Corynebacterium bovis TaxID=36808 RepID=UPI00254C0189|nr:zinc ABC transporter substrate-binding protein [Corynebacterium bovis]MDK8510006.1 zinc ABC transporter substrate-binding protein [Corynebacterium bovis]